MKHITYILTLLILTFILSGCGAILMGITYTNADKKKLKEKSISNHIGWIKMSNKIDSLTITQYLLKKEKLILDTTNQLMSCESVTNQLIKLKYRKKILCGQITPDSTLLITNIFINKKYYKGDTINRKYSETEFNKSIYYNNHVSFWHFISKGSEGYLDGIKINSAYRLKKRIYRNMNKTIKKAKNSG